MPKKNKLPKALKALRLVPGLGPVFFEESAKKARDHQNSISTRLGLTNKNIKLRASRNISCIFIYDVENNFDGTDRFFESQKEVSGIFLKICADYYKRDFKALLEIIEQASEEEIAYAITSFNAAFKVQYSATDAQKVLASDIQPVHKELTEILPKEVHKRKGVLKRKAESSEDDAPSKSRRKPALPYRESGIPESLDDVKWMPGIGIVFIKKTLELAGSCRNYLRGKLKLTKSSVELRPAGEISMLFVSDKNNLYPNAYVQNPKFFETQKNVMLDFINLCVKAYPRYSVESILSQIPTITDPKEKADVIEAYNLAFSVDFKATKEQVALVQISPLSSAEPEAQSEEKPISAFAFPAPTFFASSSSSMNMSHLSNFLSDQDPSIDELKGDGLVR